ncbi:unnamed protein product [Leuciscus chuanchicus]
MVLLPQTEMPGCLKAVCKSSLLLSWAWTAALGEEGADELRPQHNSSMLRSFHLLYDLLSTRPVLSCNWALRESLAGEVSQRNTITVEEFQYAGPDTRGVRSRAEPSRSAETGLNATNET